MPDEVSIPAGDVVGEQVILAAAIADWGGEGARLLDRHQPDLLSDPRHRAAWAALREMRRRRMEFDWAALQRLAGDADVSSYLQNLSAARPLPAADLSFHVANAEWDRKVAQVAGGPLPALIELLQKRGDPARARALGRAVAEALQGGGGDAFVDRDELVRESMAEIDRRIAGLASYPFGIPGLDVDQETGQRRLICGAAPGQVTIVTGVSGSGKSTVTANLVLGLARQGRRILYGAWEVKARMTIQLLATISLGLSRRRVIEGARDTGEVDGEGNRVFEPLLTRDERDQLRDRMEAISQYVTFMGNPFRRGRGKGERRGRDWDWAANERNLDTIHEHISESGCDVFVGDLWERCLIDTSPQQLSESLKRQHEMVEELDVHALLVQQQRLKDIETRPDKRPTRDGIKDSATYVEIGDNILGIHRAAQWKRQVDDKLQILILKQRNGGAPLCVEHDWDPDKGAIWGGRSIEYEFSPTDAADVFVEPGGAMKRRGRGGKKKW